MTKSENVPEVANHHKIITSLVAGAIAGAIAKTVIAPLDRTKIAFQVSSKRFSFRAAWRYVYGTVKYDGVLTLWRGNSATMARVIPFAAIQFTAHEQWKHILNVEKNGELNPGRRFLAGSLAGFTASSLTYPLDMARARLAVSKKSQYKSLSSVFVKIHTTEGMSALYRGLTPTLLGTVLYAGCSFFTYETLKREVRFYRESSFPNEHSSTSQSNYRLSPLERLICGAVAGLVGQTTSYPLDIARRRMQTGVAPPGHSTVRILRGVWSQEGFIHGLFKGLSMNWMKGPVAVGISFTVFDTVVATLRHLPYFHYDDDSPA